MKKKIKEPRLNSLVKLAEKHILFLNSIKSSLLREDAREVIEMLDSNRFIYLGEIPNMRGHCIVVDILNKKILHGYHIENFVELDEDEVWQNLTPDLLKGRWKHQEHPLDGHCYIATEALYHLLNGERYQPYFASYLDKVGKATHWWLVDKKTGEIFDPTKEQYLPQQPPYNIGRRGGFLTKKPSKRCKTLLSRIKTLNKS